MVPDLGVKFKKSEYKINQRKLFEYGLSNNLKKKKKEKKRETAIAESKMEEDAYIIHSVYERMNQDFLSSLYLSRIQAKKLNK